MNTSALEPLSRLALAIFRAQQALSTDGDRLTSPYGLTSAQWKVMGAVALADENPTAAAIGRAMGMSRQAAIKQVRLLLERGVLDQHDDPHDARAPRYTLTRMGSAAYAKISTNWNARARSLTIGLRKADIAAACDLIDALVRRLETEG